MTRDEAEQAREVFLAALAEAGHPLPPDTVWIDSFNRVAWHFHVGVPMETYHRAATLAAQSVGEPSPCFYCWMNTPTATTVTNPCSLGDCRAPIEETA